MLKWLKLKPRYRLEIYMKSGNVIKLDNVTRYCFENQGNEINGLRLEQSASRRLLIKTIDMSQIEAVVAERLSWVS